MQGLLSNVSRKAFAVFKTTLPEKFQIEEKEIEIDTNWSDKDLNQVSDVMKNLVGA